MRIGIFILFAVLIASCTPQQRLAHLLARHPELVRTDTVFRHDTVVVKARSVDTVFYYKQTDTIIKKEGGAVIKYYYNVKDSTVFLQGKCDTIRIIREIPIQVTQVEAKPLSWMERAWVKIKDFLIVLLLGAILVLIYLQRKKLPI